MNSMEALDIHHCPLDGINLIEASAGTGKTWTICGLYLRLLLECELPVQQILVVTFTNAATAELRERIRARIAEMTAFLAARAPTGDPFIRTLADRVIDECGIDEQAVIGRLNRALQCFDEASIFTIHGFCQRALADNPFSAGLPMTAELVEDDQDLLMEAVNDFWRRHVAAASVTAEFARYLISRNDSPERYAKLLKRHLAKPLATHRWPAEIDDPLSDAASLDRLYEQARTTWLAHGTHIADFLVRSLPSLKGTSYKETTVRAGAADWDRLCRDATPKGDIGEKARLFRTAMLARETNTNKKKNRTTPVHAFFGQAEAYLAERERVDASFALARLRLLRRLFAEAGSQLRALKLSRQVISFDDMLSNVHERLGNASFPGLAASIKTRFPAALIDEFQDTDPLQFDIFRMIYTGDDSKVFVVGDPKQAIYSFRNADLHTYLRATAWATRQWSLADNQRSGELLLTAQNALFEANSRAFILQGLDYRHVQYGEKRRRVFGDRSATRGAMRAPLQVWRLPEEPLTKGMAKLAAAQASAAEIARLIDSGSRRDITLDGEPLRPRDIAVLVRTRALGALVKQALASLRVGAVEMTRSSVFCTADAQDLEIVLTAILVPTRDALVRAALATDLVGCSVRQIEATAGDEALLMTRIRQFSDYHDLWFDRGFGVMYRRLLTDQAVAGRMLSRADGERRLTNILHLGESLSQAEEIHAAPEALLRHLRRERDDVNAGDAAQLRLESDQNLVQIVTIHACKGLEYPVVFCPFLCDGGTRPGGPALEGREYHDQQLRPVIDFREFRDDDPELTRIKATLQSEQAAETVRLLYVALTRAVHRCYLVAGSYLSRNLPRESARSMLNWLVAGQGSSLAAWYDAEMTADELGFAWQRFAQSNPGAVDVSPLPQGGGTPVEAIVTDAGLSTPMAPLAVHGGWRLSSYSGLTYGARSDQAADRDARAVPSRIRLTIPADIAEDDVLRFPRGPSAGECIHAVFEEMDFTDRVDWEIAITTALVSHPQTLVGFPQDEHQRRLAGMLLHLVNDVTEATLLPGLQLCSLPRKRRLTELEFTFSAPALSAGELNAGLHELGYEMPVLRFGNLHGYLKGFIDLIFEHQGQFFILDWKSNHLGCEAADYAAGPVAQAMAEHGYHLQYLLYTLALDRYLRLRIPDYRYETHFGGVLYLFVRGVRRAWVGADGATPGVYFHRPAQGTVRLLDHLLESSPHKERTT